MLLRLAVLKENPCNVLLLNKDVLISGSEEEAVNMFSIFNFLSV